MKSKHLLYVSILIAVSLLLSACGMIPFMNIVRGSGNLVSQTREVSQFNEILLQGAGRLIITQAETESLEIRAEDNLIGELTSDVVQNQLVLGFKTSPLRKSLVPSRMITYTLTVTDLTKVVIDGAADIEMATLETSSLDLTINGAGQINIDQLVASDLKVTIAGAGTMNLGGQVNTQSVSIEGAGNYQAGNLQTKSTKIKISGLGNGSVWATDTLEITITGGGSLDYYGNPSVTQDIRGLGNINNLGEK